MALRERIQEKSSLDFLKQLESYVEHVEKTRFQATEIRIGGRLFTEEFITQAYEKRRGKPISTRLRWVAEVIAHNLWLKDGYEITAKERAGLNASLKKMCRHATLRALYKEFFGWLGKPELFKPIRNSRLEYADLFPLIYLKMRLEGVDNPYKNIRHLLIDEMQDYAPVQYAVIARLFPGGKTILGDVNQSINPFSASTSETISQVFRQAECVKLCKSYRSSYEITQFAQAISPNPDLIAIERHGAQPVVTACTTRQEQTALILQVIKEFRTLTYQTLGIICKSQKQAERLHKALCTNAPEVHMLDAHSTAFVQGVVICTAYLAKGLEFDQVLVSDADAKTYANTMDRNMLYVACTRAMHTLTLTYVGKLTPLVDSSAL